MGGLGAGGDVEGGEPRLVERVDDLCVFETEAAVIDFSGGSGDGIEGVASGSIADGVDADCEANPGPGFGE